ncbi:unnamed protein product [Meloidogyne enterolobii]|uniref:Uncharacterized protein n=1 Tax=Meloidogyne enterolobii TaxID=390850 RepID=A0ACB0YCG2_MELEN
MFSFLQLVNIIFNSFVDTIRCIWFNNPSVDTYCHKTISSVANENSSFSLGTQNDPHECLLWLLNKLDREFLDFLESYEYTKYKYSERNAYGSCREKIYSVYEKSKENKKSTFLKLFE